MKQKKENRRMTSIARKINSLWVFKQFTIYLSLDIMITLMVIACWCIAGEIDFFGSFRLFGPHRSFEMQGGIETIFYIVSQRGSETLRLNSGLFFIMLRTCAIITGIVQMISLIRSMLNDARLIRQRLHPLNELAKKAEELSSIAFDESKFQQLEDAITHVHPENEDEHLQIGDKDLMGISVAVNNLMDRMRESYRQQSRFVSDASHELRTPISVIQGYVNMLDRWGKEDETVLTEAIEALKHESEHMSKLVEQLLFLARSDSGRNRMTIEEISLTVLMEEVFEESKMIDEEHVYQIKIEDADDVKVMGDATMLKQTMRILADNAAKYTKPGDEIIFSVGALGDAFFYVQDTGTGMGESDVVHVFERFYRSDEARNSKSDGTGLGLPIAKWIVDKHKGHFDILSRKELGTRITVFLPLAGN